MTGERSGGAGEEKQKLGKRNIGMPVCDLPPSEQSALHLKGHKREGNRHEESNAKAPRHQDATRQAATKGLEQEHPEKTETERFCQKCATFRYSTAKQIGFQHFSLCLLRPAAACWLAYSVSFMDFSTIMGELKHGSEKATPYGTDEMQVKTGVFDRVKSLVKTG